MKKTLLVLGLAAVAALGFTACNSTDAKTDGDKNELYSGILPVADNGLGTIYTLKLELDDDNNYTDGDYSLVENTLVADTTTASGLNEAATGYSKGDFKKMSKQINGTKVEYLVLTPQADKKLGFASTDVMYFIINPDGSLTMANAALEMPSTPELYTLAKK